VPSSTLPPPTDVTRERRAWGIRTATLLLVTGFVMAGLVGCFGVTSGEVTARSPGGMTIAVTYPQRTRPALASPFSVEVTRPGGFDAAVEVAITTDYVESFDENGLNPDPDSATTDGEMTTWTFEAPEGDTFTVWLDTRVEPGVQWKRSGTVHVTVGDDDAEAGFTSWIFP
jgi:hypothetical protein